MHATRRLAPACAVPLGDPAPPDLACVGELPGEGPCVAVATRDGSIMVVADRCEPPACRSTPLGHLSAMCLGALGGTGELSVVAANADGDVFVVDPVLGHEAAYAGPYSLSALAAAPSGALVAGSSDGWLRWLRLDEAAGAFEPERELLLPGAVRSVAALDDGRVVAGLDNGRFSLVGAGAGAGAAAEDEPLTRRVSERGGVGAGLSTGATLVAVCADNEAIVCACMDGTVAALDAAGAPLWHSYVDAPLTSLSLVYGGDLLLLGGADGSVWLQGGNGGRPLRLDVRPRPTAMAAGEFLTRGSMLLCSPDRVAVYDARDVGPVERATLRTAIGVDLAEVRARFGLVAAAPLAAGVPTGLERASDSDDEHPVLTEDQLEAAALRNALYADVAALEAERDALLSASCSSASA